MGSADDQNLKVLNEQQIISFKHKENIINPLCNKIMSLFYLTQTLSMSIIESLWVGAGSAVTCRREPKSCLGRVFNSKLGCITALLSKCSARMPQPLLELKTRPRARPVSLSLSMVGLYQK
jgi:hypothetical protein